MKRSILSGLLAIAISIPCWAGYPGDYTDQSGGAAQSGQSSQGGQVGQEDPYGQSGQTNQGGQTDQTGSYGYPGQSGQSGQSGQCGQSNGGTCERPPMESGCDSAKLQTVISLLSMVESDLAMCTAETGRWSDNVMAIGYVNSARSALERAPMDPVWKPLLSEIYERLGRIRFHLLMNDDVNARMMMSEVQAIVRSTVQSLLINSGNGGSVVRPRVVVMPQIPTSGGSYGSNSNSGSGWGSAWGSGWASGWGNGGGIQLPPSSSGPFVPTNYPPLIPTR